MHRHVDHQPRPTGHATKGNTHLSEPGGGGGVCGEGGGERGEGGSGVGWGGAARHCA